jgi:hypothetical protein
MSEQTPPLQKFYVQSNGHRWVLAAPDVEGAALRFTQLVLRGCVRGKQSVSPTMRLIDEARYQKIEATFGETVDVSESGFQGERVGIFYRADVIELWKQQMESLESIIRKME